MAAVASLPCSLCSAPQPSQCHHIEQQKHFITVALCDSCHKNWTGTKTLWIGLEAVHFLTLGWESRRSDH